MKKIIREFGDFIAKGNVMDLAIGVIIGAAFGSIVNSLVSDILSPIIGLFANTHLDNLVWQIGEVRIGYGSFLTAVINFLLIAIALFFIVKSVNKAEEIGEKILIGSTDEPAPEPTTVRCPYCKQEVAVDATRCPFCTSELPPAQQGG